MLAEQDMLLNAHQENDSLTSWAMRTSTGWRTTGRSLPDFDVVARHSLHRSNGSINPTNQSGPHPFVNGLIRGFLQRSYQCRVL